MEALELSQANASAGTPELLQLQCRICLRALHARPDRIPAPIQLT